jgi:RNA polymerase sigma factor (sigma-70 family)
MTEPDDIALLREFVATESEAAFAALVSRHVNLVHSVALRSTGSPHAAQEISQAVFIILARKAKSLGSKTILSGGLYQTTRLTAANFLRTEIRRQKREQEAYMQSILNEPEPEAWWQIAPLLDDALDKLGERDRNAIVLRFFENKYLRDVDAGLGVNEDAAKMRVTRALEKLRKLFVRRGAALSAVVIAGAVAANSVQAAPVALTKSMTAVAMMKGVAASGSTLTLIKGVLKIMAWTTAKMASAVCVGLLLAIGATTMTVKEIQAHHRYSWQMPKATRDLIRNTPPQVVIVPTRFSQDGGMYRDYTKGGGTIGICQSVTNIVRVAFDNDIPRMILSQGLPEGGFDFFAKVSDTDWP